MQRIRSHRVNSLPVFLNQNNCHARRSIISRWGMCDGGSEVEDSPWELEKIDINTLATFVSLIPCQHFEGFPDNSVGKESVCNAGDSGLIPGSRRFHRRRNRLPTPVFPCGSAGKESACNAGDMGLIPGLGRCPGEGKGYPHQYYGLENSTNFIVHGSQQVGHD